MDFFYQNKKNNVYPCNPQFYYIKVGFKGVKIISACFRDGCKPLPAIGNSDHDAILYDTTLKSQRPKRPRRKIYLWKRANVEAIQENVIDLILAHQEEITDIN